MNLSQAEIDRIFIEVYNEYLTMSDEHQRKLINEFEVLLSESNRYLLEYAEENGEIKRNRINTLLRELDKVEIEVRDASVDDLERLFSEKSRTYISEIVTALGLAISVVELNRLSKRVVRELFRKGSDGLTLNHRLWSVSADVKSTISDVIRRNVIRGVAVSKISSEIKDAFDKQVWKVHRIVRTETMKAYRKTVTEVARFSGFKWVRFFDGTCGRPDHHKHACYKLVKEDRYGKGRGIFKASDPDILNPHPQCTSHYTLLLERSD